MSIGEIRFQRESDRIELAQNCLRLISKIALRGACSLNPEQIGYALQELSQVLIERTGTDRIFEPVAANQIPGLERLLEELDFLDGMSQALSRGENGLQ